MAYTLGDITSASSVPNGYPALSNQSELVITLTAGQAAGTSAVLAADGRRKSLILGNPGANAMLVNLVSGAAAGVGVPLPSGGVLAFGQDLPCPTNDIYVLGTAGDKLTILVG